MQWPPSRCDAFSSTERQETFQITEFINHLVFNIHRDHIIDVVVECGLTLCRVNTRILLPLALPGPVRIGLIHFQVNVVQDDQTWVLLFVLCYSVFSFIYVCLLLLCYIHFL